jgi:molybdopterin converting factor small subunit
MKITIRFRGPIAGRITGGALEMNVKEGLTIANLLDVMIKQEPYVRALWKNPIEIDRDSLILCNDIDIGVVGGLEAVPRDGDALTILPLVHGG